MQYKFTRKATLPQCHVPAQPGEKIKKTKQIVKENKSVTEPLTRFNTFWTHFYKLFSKVNSPRNNGERELDISAGHLACMQSLP